MSFTIPKFAWPMTIVTGENDEIVFDELDGAGDVTVTIPDGTYYWRNDGSADDMRVVLQTAMNTDLTGTYTIGMGAAVIAGTSVGVLTMATASGDFQVEWDNGNTTANPAWFGFASATYVATNPASWIVQSPYYVGRTWFPEQEWVDQEYTQPVYNVSQQIMADGSIDTQQWGVRYDRDILLDVLPLNKVWQEYEDKVQEAFVGQNATTERPSDWIAAGECFEFCPDYTDRDGVLTNEGVYSKYKPRGGDFLSRQEFVVPTGLVNRFNIWIRMTEYVE